MLRDPPFFLENGTGSGVLEFAISSNCFFNVRGFRFWKAFLACFVF